MRAQRILIAVLATMALAACANAGREELSQWMVAERLRIKPDVKPIPAPTEFTPKSYDVFAEQEPFSSEKLASVLRGAQTSLAASSALIEPELKRRKEPLELFPLDAATMVGSLNKSGSLVALIKVESLLYQLKPGNYLGQNYGKIQKISETDIQLREIVQDAAGEWIERPTTIQLQEEATK